MCAMQKIIPKKTKKQNLAKRSAVLNAAIKVFAKKGFNDATISEIAKEAHVSEPTIYGYFSTKEELLFQIPSELSFEHQKETVRLIEHIPGAANKLSILVSRQLSLYVEHEDYGTVLMLILNVNRNFLNTERYHDFRLVANKVMEVLEEGIKNGEFRSGLDPYAIRAMLWGTMENLVSRKSLVGEPKDPLALMEQVMDMVFRGILDSKQEQTINVNINLNNEMTAGVSKGDPLTAYDKK